MWKNSGFNVNRKAQKKLTNYRISNDKKSKNVNLVFLQAAKKGGGESGSDSATRQRGRWSRSEEQLVWRVGGMGMMMIMIIIMMIIMINDH